MKTVLLLAFALVVPCHLAADDEGHHHEDLSEAQLGTVHFPSSCAAAVQKPIERGVAMLHSFWYEEAEKEFEQIEKDDPQCAIANWGVAMSLWHQLWNRPELAVLQRGGEQLKHAEHLRETAREKDYIKALEAFYQHPKRSYEKRATAYSSAMQKVMQRNPDDHEAAAFYALSLLAADSDKDNTSRTKAAAVLEKLFVEEPQHPGVAHYLIHTYDKPEMAERAFLPRESTLSSRPPRLTRCTCRHISSRGSACGRTTLIQTSAPSKPLRRKPPCTWAAKGISSTPWIFWFTRTCKLAVKKTRRRSLLKCGPCRR